MLTFPVNHGETLNIVAFRTTSIDWPDRTRLTRAATQKEAICDFAGYGPDVIELLRLTKPDLDIVS